MADRTATRRAPAGSAAARPSTRGAPPFGDTTTRRARSAAARRRSRRLWRAADRSGIARVAQAQARWSATTRRSAPRARRLAPRLRAPRAVRDGQSGVERAERLADRRGAAPARARSATSARRGDGVRDVVDVRVRQRRMQRQRQHLLAHPVGDGALSGEAGKRLLPVYWNRIVDERLDAVRAEALLQDVAVRSAHR